ncbi:methylosome subunit pICln-like [Saccostrea echinata]|uniref:methylosome subunit pICln-like n=1 Tax=Saccostrea echinata TaxID=191078 RepID=UPI002A8129A1|nr:methylosome subunit pICln-like [Saccostrea echinata]
MILTAIDIPTEGVRHVQDETVAFVDDTSQGNGSLYVTESLLTWRNSNGQGFSLQYPAISLHAVSRDLMAFSQECLYLMVDGKLTDDTESGRRSSSDEEVVGPYEGDTPTTEVRFVPADKGSLDAMFNAMSDCQALHPDEQDTDSEAEEFDANYYEGEEGEQHLTMEGQRTLQHLENLLLNGQGDGPTHQNTNGNEGNPDPMDQDQFADADQ